MDLLAKEGAEMSFTGPEAVLGVTKRAVKTSAKIRMHENANENWNNSNGTRHDKQLTLEGFSKKKKKNI